MSTVCCPWCEEKPAQASVTPACELLGPALESLGLILPLPGLNEAIWTVCCDFLRVDGVKGKVTGCKPGVREQDEEVALAW